MVFGKEDVLNVRRIISLYKDQAPLLRKIRRDVEKLPPMDREAVIIKLYLESELDEVDIAEKLFITTIEVVRILQANRIY
jgi:DNA-directed RNA polymerase specialized sigma subunit